MKNKKVQQREVLCGADRDKLSSSNMKSQFPFDHLFLLKFCQKALFFFFLGCVIVSVDC